MNINKTSLLYNDDKKLRQGYVELKKQTTEQLAELIERQNKLLKNKLFIDKLPDKGKKIIAFKNELEEEHKRRKQAYDSACQLLSSLTLNELNAGDIEWSDGGGKQNSRKLDSDDDEEEEYGSDSQEDTLKIIASHSGTHSGVTKKAPTQLINNSSSETNLNYSSKMCQKYDAPPAAGAAAAQAKERFKPNQLKENNLSSINRSSEKVKERLGEKWEVTEATPPVFNYNSVKPVSLVESLKLQKEQADKLKETEMKHATERLMNNIKMKMTTNLPIKNTQNYRNVESHFNESANDDDEDNNSENENVLEDD